MDEQIKSTIEVLTAKIRAKEEETNKLKRLVNELSAEAGLESIPFPNIQESSQQISSIRSDQFYGLPLSTAARNYLEMRKAADLGAATVNEIFSAIKGGGYKFSTKDEENAKTTLRMSLRKNSSIFHRLPNGEYGLLSWYPNAKEQPSSDGADAPEGRHDDSTHKNPAVATKDSYITPDQIRNVVFAMQGNFKITDVDLALRKQLPGKTLKSGALPTTLFLLKKKGFLRVVTERSGKTGAVYTKA